MWNHHTHSTHLLNRGYSIVSSGDVLLGQLNMLFQLHAETLPTGKGRRKRKSEGQAAPAFVVGPGATGLGATFKKKSNSRQASSETDANLRNKENILERVDLVETPGFEPETADVGGTVPDELKVPPTSDKLPLAIGRQQMEVISELLDRGTKLRDKMVQSLSMGTQMSHQQKYTLSWLHVMC